MIVEIDELSRRYQLRNIPAFVDVAVNKAIGGGVENVQLTPKVVERRRLRRIRHHRQVTKWLTIVADGDAVAVFSRHSMTRFRLVQTSIRFLSRHYSPTSGDLTSVESPPTGITLTKVFASASTLITATVWPRVFAT